MAAYVTGASYVLLVKGHDDDNYKYDAGDDDSCDLGCAVWAFAYDLTCAGVDGEVVELIVIFICADPDGQEDIFQAEIKIIGDYVIDALFIPSDVGNDEIADGGRHAVFGFFEACFGVDLEEFGAETADVLFIVMNERFQCPWLEAAGYIWGQGVAG